MKRDKKTGRFLDEGKIGHYKISIKVIGEQKEII